MKPVKEIVTYFRSRLKNRQSILYKMITASTVTTTLFLLITGFSSYVITRYTVTEDYKDYAENILDENAEFVSFVSYMIANMSNELSANEEFTSIFTGYNQAEDNLGELISSASAIIRKTYYVSAFPLVVMIPELIQEIYFYNNDYINAGIEVPYLTSRELLEVQNSHWYQKAVELDGGTFWTEPIKRLKFQTHDEVKTVRNVRLIKDTYGKTCGVISIEFRPHVLATKLAESELGKRGKIYIANSDYVILSHIDKEKIGQKLPQTFINKYKNGNSFFLTIDGQKVFHVVKKSQLSEWLFIATIPASQLYASSNIIGLAATGIFVFCLLLIVLYNSYFSYKLSHPIENIIDVTKKISSGDYNASAPLSGIYEIDQLSNNFNAMQKIVNTYRQDLENLVEERTMQLVEAEKMASLGQLVAGIAHEINTPVGISVTAATHLEKLTHEFEKKFHHHSLKATDMESYLADLTEAIDIISDNLHKASTLVYTFKQVAVDRKSENKRTFDIKNYLHEITSAVLSNYNDDKYVINVNCLESIQYTGYPGFFSQIISSLLINSIEHGFHNSGEGNIYIDVKRVGDEVHINYYDDGSGIPEEHIKKVFDPFFTTSRGAGNTGLGLNIVYNIVKQKFDGIIRCIHSKEGAVFEIVLPL